jgi:hypothetical protein
MGKKPKPSPISDAVRDMAFSTYTCAWCAVQPMRGTARDVDGSILPSCGLKGCGKPL